MLLGGLLAFSIYKSSHWKGDLTPFFRSYNANNIGKLIESFAKDTKVDASDITILFDGQPAHKDTKVTYYWGGYDKNKFTYVNNLNYKDVVFTQ